MNNKSVQSLVWCMILGKIVVADVHKSLNTGSIILLRPSSPTVNNIIDIFNLQYTYSIQQSKLSTA